MMAKILIADDSPVNLTLLQHTLESLVCHVESFSSGQEVLQAVASHQPDLILLDIIMPDIDGIEVCRHLKQNSAWAGTPVIFLTAHDDAQMLQAGFAAAGVDFLTDPFRTEELTARIRTHIEINRLTLAAEHCDNETASHFKRMSRYSVALTQRIGITTQQLEYLELASPMHDVGKIGVPDHFLLKSGKLTPRGSR